MARLDLICAAFLVLTTIVSPQRVTTKKTATTSATIPLKTTTPAKGTTNPTTGRSTDGATGTPTGKITDGPIKVSTKKPPTKTTVGMTGTPTRRTTKGPIQISTQTPPKGAPTGSSVAESCEHGSMNLNCGSGQKLTIISAMYGRMDTAICPSALMSDTKCKSDTSLEKVKEKCEGQSSCSVSATNGVFGDPCPWTEKYLEVKYACDA